MASDLTAADVRELMRKYDGSPPAKTDDMPCRRCGEKMEVDIAESYGWRMKCNKCGETEIEPLGIVDDQVVALCRLALAVLEPEWSKEPPTFSPAVGYDCYWVLAPNGARFIVKVESRSLMPGVLIYRFGQTIPTTPDDYVGYQWAGPIKPPTRAENAELRGSNG